MAGMFEGSMMSTIQKLSSLVLSAIQKLSSLVLSATPASSSSITPSEAQTTALENLKTLEEGIQSVLTEARERDIRDHSTKFWLEELQKVAYDAEDAVGDYEYDVLHAKLEARDEMLGLSGGSNDHEHVLPWKVIDLDSIKVSVPVSEEIARRVKAIRERFEEITRDWDALRLSESDAPRRKNQAAITRPPTSSHVQESTIYGRDDDRENIINRLLSEDGTSKNDTVNVISIIGMGGIGKTTLAQLVYNDTRVSEHFELKGWVCVSEDFDVVLLTKKILESFTGESSDLTNLDTLQSNLKKEVQNKIFLLVLDDVWNEDKNLWDSLCVPLTFAKSGIILVTARSSIVANAVQTKHSYELLHLNSEACWSLFKQLVFGDKEKNSDDHLVKIANQIVAKCRGLPLAVTTIGKVLRYEHDIECWIDILKSKELGSNTRNGNFLPILKISYDHMPSHLKKCFAFFALFPKSHCFMEDCIVNLWVSMKLIHSNYGKKVEDEARTYIKELQERSMIQPHTISDQHGFVVHDLLHDLAQQVTKDEVCSWELEKKVDLDDAIAEIPCQLSTEVRYLSVVISSTFRNGEINFKDFVGLPNLRAALVHCSEPSNNNRGLLIRIPNNVFGHLRNVRALDLRHSTIKCLPPSIGNLKQLCYLNLSKTGIQFLPESACNLYNLETLELTGCYIYKLPDGIRKLSKLRHLNCYHRKMADSYKCPYGIGLLTNLQSLSLFVVGESSSECDICELRDLVYLSKTLRIRGLQNVTNMNHAKEASLQKKKYLENLTFDFGSPDTMINGRKYEEQLLKTLEPHPNLKKLVIQGYGGSNFPQWMGHIFFSKLVKVKLSNFACKQLPPVGQLPSLKIVNIEYANNIIDIGPEFIGYHGELDHGFQSLESMEIHSLTKLERWFGDKKSDFPKLERLNIYYCDELTRIPNLSSLSLLYVTGKIREELMFNSHLPQLKTLEIGTSGEIRNLNVSSCNFPLLQVLTVSICEKLESLKDLRSLTSLKKLVIGLCPQLYLNAANDFPPSLEEYRVEECGCPNMEKLPAR